MVKVTFTLDEKAVSHLKEAARRLAKSKSEIIREGIEEVYQRSDRLSDEERTRMIAYLKDYAKRKLPTRPPGEAQREIEEIRKSRRTGWRPGAR
jgi:metal-responsive CopG/Arc/MetJ family transcriptional regulator